MSDPINSLVRDMIQKAADAMPEPRWSKQEKLEQLISDFNPDFEEAGSLLGVIFGRSFELGRCSNGQWDIVEDALKDFTRRLSKAADLHPEQPDYEPSADDPE